MRADVIGKFIKERNEALIDFVRSDNPAKFFRYAKKYGVQTPKDERIMAGGIYKAVYECEGIPEDIKKLAAEKCLALGFKNPGFGKEDLR